MRLPHAFCLADSPEGRALVAGAGGGKPLPLVVFPNGESSPIRATPNSRSLRVAR